MAQIEIKEVVNKIILQVGKEIGPTRFRSPKIM